MNKLLLVSSAHRVEKEKEFSKYFKNDFSVILVPDLKIKLKKKHYKAAFLLFLKSIKLNFLFDLKKINYKTFISVCFEDLTKNNFNFVRISWFAFRVFWLAKYSLKKNDIFIFRGINDPLIKYLKLKFLKNNIYLLPHGTDFVEPYHEYWKYSDFWVTDLKKFKVINKSTKVLTYGRLDYYDIPRKKINKKILNLFEIKNIGLIFPHTTINLMESQIFNIKNSLNLLNLSPNIIMRPHPGDKKSISYLLKKNMYCKLSLEEFMIKSDILLFPIGHEGWVSNLYYESSFRGKVSGAIINFDSLSKNIPKNLLLNVDKNIIPLNNYFFEKWLNKLSKIGYSNKVILNEFTSSIKIREKLLKHFIDHQ